MDNELEGNEKEALAHIRQLYKEADIWLRKQRMRQAAEGHYLVVQALVGAFLSSTDVDLNSIAGQRMRKPAERAMTAALQKLFGEDLDNVYVAKGSDEYTQLHGCTAFAVESDAFPARLLNLETAAEDQADGGISPVVATTSKGRISVNSRGMEPVQEDRPFSAKSRGLPEESSGRPYSAKARSLPEATPDAQVRGLPPVEQQSAQQYVVLPPAAESNEFRARPLNMEKIEAKRARAQRKHRRSRERDGLCGDYANRPVTEGGHPMVDDNAHRAEGSSRYLSELLKLDCGPELLKLRLFPAAKELTESFAAFAAVRNHLGSVFSPDDANVTVVCVGDGKFPRTAALFAYRTKWQCYSVDPQMQNPGPSWGGVQRLEARCARIEETQPWFHAQKMLVVCVHAHVGLAECLSVMDWEQALGIVAMPSGNFYSRLKMPEPHLPLAEYYDPGIVSPHRLVRIWFLEGINPLLS